MKVVSFSIFKGGTGKTTSTVNTAASLVKKGKRVLLVDLDQQASAPRYLDLDPEQSPNLYEVFTGKKSVARATARHIAPGSVQPVVRSISLLITSSNNVLFI